MKKCNKCLLDKNPGDFYNDKKSLDGLYSSCKECKNKCTDNWRNQNKKYYNTTMRKYNKNNYCKLRLQRYKLTPEQHAQMLTEQNHVCAICKRPPGGKRPLAVDHRHSDGKVRGLLCYNCNRALHVLESVELLEKAQEYLKKYL